MFDHDEYITREVEDDKPVFRCDKCGNGIYPGNMYVIESGLIKCTNCVEILRATEDDYEF